MTEPITHKTVLHHLIRTIDAARAHQAAVRQAAGVPPPEPEPEPEPAPAPAAKARAGR